MSIRILLIKNTYDNLGSFERYFSLRGLAYGSVFYDRLLRDPDPALYDGIILSGTDHPPLVRNLSLYDDEIRLIQSTTLPVLGICGGMQIISQAFGGCVDRLEQPLYGRIQVSFTAGERLFRGLPEPCTMFARHLYYVSRVPDGFETIARSWPRGVVYGLRHTARPLFGVQFHPERRNDGYAFLDNYIDLLQTVDVASHNAPDQPDRLTAAISAGLPGRPAHPEKPMR